MRIAYIGPAHGTSLHRARALERLGHELTIVDPWSWLGASPWIDRWLWHTGGVGVGLAIDDGIFRRTTHVRPDLIWIDQGQFLGRSLLQRLRRLGRPIINYTIDNPFSRVHRRRFRRYRQAVREVDLLAVVRESNVEEAHTAGARRVVRVWRSADEVAHRPRSLTRQQHQAYASDVTFVGTWMPERGPFLARLVERGVALSIWGDRWHRAAEWHTLRPYWRGPALNDDDSYAAAIQSAKVCLGLVSARVGDLHTTRSMEIPALGGLFCAQRTSEHLDLYEEGSEAQFWADADECAAACRQLLADEPRRRQLAASGRARALRNRNYNQPVLASLIETALTHSTVAS